ncbi:LysM peptidoglycan-binding domain-containing protein [Nonomuraea sp. NPDC050663]|uniref:LysM peptidoglycan-binding domain-containing protein n=1 Tax=Nonomuraea sp. NPDC050663 TaxID=3364370 RepID=UPI0037BD8404
MVKVGERALSGGGTPGVRHGGAKGRSPAAGVSVKRAVAPRSGKGARPGRLSSVPKATNTRSTTQIRLTRRGRVVVVLVIAFFTLAGFWLGTRAAGFAAEASVVPHTNGLAWVEVKGGDTLWTIAGTVAGHGSDPDAVARQIMSLNGLDSSLIRPGTRLYLPHVR